MFTSSLHRSAGVAGRVARPGHHQRNGGPSVTPEPSPGEYDGRPLAVPDLPHESIDDRGWDERVAREVRHQEVIEASFDRAEAYARLGDFEHALEWLDRATAVSGGLPPAYRARRARWARAAAFRPRPAGGDWKNRLARSGESGAPMTAEGSGVASSAGATDPEQSLVFELPARPTAGAAARRALIAGNGALPSSVRDDVLLLVTELVSTAVRHAPAGADGPLRVELRRRARTVRVAVFDEGSGFTAEASNLKRDGSGGWGLFLVDRIADRWAIMPTASGTCALFEIRCQQ
jgi:anti-sigma regulatory factor (Ser/Thr protein kinase)